MTRRAPMRATVDPVQLAKAAREVAKGLRFGRLPVLDNVLLEAGRGRLRLSATDLSDWREATVAAAGVAPGATTVPAKLLRDLAQACKGFGPMTLEAQVQEALPLDRRRFDKRAYNRLWAQAKATGRPEVMAQLKADWKAGRNPVRVEPDGAVVCQPRSEAGWRSGMGARPPEPVETLEVRCPRFNYVAHLRAIAASEFPPRPAPEAVEETAA